MALASLATRYRQFPSVHLTPRSFYGGGWQWPSHADSFRTQNTGGYPIDHYSAYQSGTLKTDNIAGLTTTINGLAKGQSSTFTVRAVTSKATSVDSNSLSATPTGVPDAPTGLTAAPTNTQITLSWTAPANTGGLTIDHYTVSQGGTVKVDNIAGLTTIISGLTNGQSYTFTVTATKLCWY